jgi:small-conductance mechanosensitive channel
VGNWVDADQSAGRVVHLPNSVVFTQHLYNYTQGFPFIWNELPILVTFESDWRRAKGILQRLASEQARDMGTRVAEFIRRMKHDYPIRYENLTPIVYTAVRDSGVLLTIRYLTEVRARRKTAMDLYEGVLAAFADEPQIEFAYPTYRMFRGPEAEQAGQAGDDEAPGPMNA